MKRLMRFLLGLTMGATVAMLLAPKSGRELREQLISGATSRLLPAAPDEYPQPDGEARWDSAAGAVAEPPVAPAVAEAEPPALVAEPTAAVDGEAQREAEPAGFAAPFTTTEEAPRVEGDSEDLRERISETRAGVETDLAHSFAAEEEDAAVDAAPSPEEPVAEEDIVEGPAEPPVEEAVAEVPEGETDAKPVSAPRAWEIPYDEEETLITAESEPEAVAEGVLEAEGTTEPGVATEPEPVVGAEPLDESGSEAATAPVVILEPATDSEPVAPDEPEPVVAAEPAAEEPGEADVPAEPVTTSHADGLITSIGPLTASVIPEESPATPVVEPKPGAGEPEPLVAAEPEPVAAAEPIPEPEPESIIEPEPGVEVEPTVASEAPAREGSIDQAEMRRRIEETRARLKAKAFDAMMSGEAALLSRESGEKPVPKGSEVKLDGEVETTIDESLSQEDY